MLPGKACIGDLGASCRRADDCTSQNCGSDNLCQPALGSECDPAAPACDLCLQAGTDGPFFCTGYLYSGSSTCPTKVHDDKDRCLPGCFEGCSLCVPAYVNELNFTEHNEF
jgi:hypothetical protein